MIRLLPLMLTISLLLQMTHLGYGRSIIRDNTELISDGSDSDLIIKKLRETTVTCEPLYGFLPCTKNISGQLFMIVVYQYLFSRGQRYISKASKRFIEIHGVGNILSDNLFNHLPIIPQLLMVISSGLSESTETAEQQVAMGMQLLAGSSVMMLTLVWSACHVAFASSHIPTSSTSSLCYREDTCYKRCMRYVRNNIVDFAHTTTDRKTRVRALIMLLSIIPLIILQPAKRINSSTWSRVIILLALIVTLFLLIAYFTYQVMEPRILQKKFRSLFEKYLKRKYDELCTRDGKPSEEAIKTKLFDDIDDDNDKKISNKEMGMFLKKLKLVEHDPLMGMDDLLENAMREFDNKNPDGEISEKKFTDTITEWILKARLGSLYLKPIKPKKEKPSFTGLVVDYLRAILKLLLGIAMLVILSRPYLQTVWNFSSAANIPQFLVPYVVIPFALNVKMAYKLIKAAQKAEGDISQTLSMIYESVFLNNVVGLTTFLILVYARNLSWDVSAEVLVVLIICTTMGLVGGLCRNFPFWTSLMPCLLYPISLLLLYVFTNVLQWS